MHKILQEDVARPISLNLGELWRKITRGQKNCFDVRHPSDKKNSWKRTDSAKKAVVRHPDPKPDEKFLASPSRILLPNLIRRSPTAKGN